MTDQPTRTQSGRRGYGVAGALPHDRIQAIAAAVEQAGFDSFWVNDTPGGDGLAALAAAAQVTTRVSLGVGVLPVDRWSPNTIAGRIAGLELPVERLLIGIGSGDLTHNSVEQTAEAATQLERLTAARVLIGALGPRMCAAAGRSSGGALLNWLTPAHAAATAQLVRTAAAESGRTPFIAAYVRVAQPGAGAIRLTQEAKRYGGFPSYAAHFARMGVDAIDTCVLGTPAEIDAGLRAFAEIDEVVVRAIAAEETAAYLDLVSAAKP